MPELPDVEVYIAHLKRRLLGQVLEHARVASPFVVRSFDPPLSSIEGKRVADVRRIGKRVAFAVGDPRTDDLWLVLHLMIAGRLRWRERGAKIPAKVGLAAFDFPPAPCS